LLAASKAARIAATDMAMHKNIAPSNACVKRGPIANPTVPSLY
jgi:hypothetical protein